MAKAIKSTIKKPVYSSVAFFLEDYQRTLFPLRTNKILAEAGFKKVLEFGHKGSSTSASGPSSNGPSFLPQKRVFAMKAGWHLRRTFKLDPIAEIFLYDLVYRNRALFQKSHSAHRECYGYRFEKGVPLDATSSYRAFRGAINEYSAKYKFGISFDVASYFNSIYHHDLVSWFDERGASGEDAAVLGKFLREINSGRSVDCLPQGIYPSKMIGNDFLKFIDNSNRLKSSRLVRFMDDIALFGDSREELLADFYMIQDLLGQKGLSVNPAKTINIEKANIGVEEKVSAVRKGLSRSDVV
jgi:Reverse transcriptase (RNA-dependent DNA polymerase)